MDTHLSRRKMLATSAVGAAMLTAASAANAASFGNPDEPAEGAVNVTNPKALVDPGPQDPGIANNEPSFLSPPATDVNGCRSIGRRSICRQNAFRTAAGRGRSPKTILRFRRPSRASICVLARVVSVNFIGISKLNGRS